MQLRKIIFMLYIPAVSLAGTHIQQGDSAGGALTGTYPNPTLSASAVVTLVSSAVPFGSATSTMSVNVSKLNWNNTSKTLSIGSNDYTSINQVSTFTLLTSSLFSPGNNVCYYNNLYTVLDGLSGEPQGSLFYYYNGGGNICSSFPHAGFGFSDGFGNRIMDFGVDQITNFYYTVNISTFTTSGVTFAALGSLAANGTLRYCSDCTVTTPATCTANALASCVCAGSGSGAFAKRLNNTWYCQ